MGSEHTECKKSIAEMSNAAHPKFQWQNVADRDDITTREYEPEVPETNQQITILKKNGIISIRSGRRDSFVKWVTTNSPSSWDSRFVSFQSLERFKSQYRLNIFRWFPVSCGIISHSQDISQTKTVDH